MMIGLAAILLLVAALGSGLRLYMGRSAEDRLRPGEAVAIAGFRGPVPQNGALACPPGYCAVADAVPSPVFEVPIDRLADCWAAAITGEPHVVQVAADPGRHRMVLIQHSSLFRFPDVITVEFVSLAPDRSSVAIYSRARYGRSDFGVNRRRVLRWLSRLQQIAGPAS